MKSILLLCLVFSVCSCLDVNAGFTHRVVVSAPTSLDGADKVFLTDEMTAAFAACFSSNIKSSESTTVDLTIGKNKDLSAAIQSWTKEEFSEGDPLVSVVRVCYLPLYRSVIENKRFRLTSELVVIQDNIDALSSAMAADIRIMSKHHSLLSACYKLDKKTVYALTTNGQSNGESLGAYPSAPSQQYTIYDFLRCERGKRFSDNQSVAESFAEYANAVTSIESMRKVIDRRIARKSEVIFLSQKLKVDLSSVGAAISGTNPEASVVSVNADLNRQDNNLAKKAIIAIASIIIFALAFIFVFFNLNKNDIRQ